MDLALTLRFVVAAAQLALAVAIAAMWRGAGGRALALLLALRGGAGLAAALSHAVPDVRVAHAAFVVAAAASLALAVVALTLALGTDGRWTRAGAAITFALAAGSILLEPRFYGRLGRGSVEEDGPLVALQALVWIGYAGILARLGTRDGAGTRTQRVVRRLLLVGFALDVAWIATGAARALSTGAPARVLDHLVASPSGAARIGLLLQVIGALGILAASASLLRAAARGRSPAALALLLLAALGVAAALRWSLRPGTALLLLDAAWRLALPSLVAVALLTMGAAREAVSEEAQTEWKLE